MDAHISNNLLAYYYGRGIFTIIALIGFGVYWIWKGITGDVWETPMGTTVIPAWLYIVGGILSLALAVGFIYLRLHPEVLW